MKILKMTKADHLRIPAETVLSFQLTKGIDSKTLVGDKIILFW